MRRAMERHNLAIGRLLEEKQPKNTKEAQAYIQRFIGPGKKIPPLKRGLTPLEEAQELMYDAWEEENKRNRIAMARSALAFSPDCADAYVLLAEEAALTLGEAKGFYEEGVRAGERALGREFFEREVGYFWGIVESRPYMRARLGLAEVLWGLGSRSEAIGHYRELLRLNPGDNQGVRYLLFGALLREGLDDEAKKLLAEYKDDASAEWLYGRALWAFRRYGASTEADRRLGEAMEGNRFVPFYMLGLKKMPKEMPEYMSPGEDSEAVHYIASEFECWKDTSGAFDWLAKTMAAHAHDGIKKSKTGRNDPCPCGSGRKYKKCCGRSGR